MSSKAQHKAKVKLARRLRFKHEVGGLFYSTGWLTRRSQIQERVKRHEVRAKYYKELKQGVR